MKRVRLIPAVALLAALGCTDGLSPPNPIASKVGPAAAGFDSYGYNDVARIFSGPADGVDRNLDGKVWGDPLYANDHLVMKWNREWDRGNDEGWTNPPYNAWTSNQWNGQVPGGSGETWHYKIVWVGPCTEFTPFPDGGYCIWGQFNVIFSHGNVNGHFWDAHARPSGYGSYP